MDQSLIYQVLREMDERGWIIASVEEAGQGPPRKVYSITSDGIRQLEQAMEDIHRVRQEVDNLIREYEGQ
jgi:DNA-binding PadR family transcriptional regulator